MGQDVAGAGSSHHVCKFCGSKEGTPLSSNAVNVKLLNTVEGNVNRNTGDNIRHFARPYPLWKSESVEKRERIQVSL